MEVNNKKDGLYYTIIGLAIGAALLGAIKLNNHGPTITTCSTYQGYTKMSKSTYGIVFDDETLSKRAGKPDLSMEYAGKPDFEIGEDYCVEVQRKHTGLDKIVSVEHVQ